MEINQNDVLICSCQESTYEGLPCKHEFCIFIKETKPISFLNIHPRWTLEYFNPLNLSDIKSSDEEDADDHDINDEAEREENREEFK